MLSESRADVDELNWISAVQDNQSNREAWNHQRSYWTSCACSRLLLPSHTCSCSQSLVSFYFSSTVHWNDSITLDSPQSLGPLKVFLRFKNSVRPEYYMHHDPPQIFHHRSHSLPSLSWRNTSTHLYTPISQNIWMTFQWVSINRQN